jgi:PIN domain nuclease of toxin-antitoxin system
VRPRGSPGTVLDASAVLAYLQREPGAERVAEALDRRAAISTVNLAEVLAKLVGAARPPEPVLERLLALGLVAEAFTLADAQASAALVPAGRVLGLSLGDRSCLALARRLGLPALSADRAWAGLTVGVEVRPLR